MIPAPRFRMWAYGRKPRASGDDPDSTGVNTIEFK